MQQKFLHEHRLSNNLINNKLREQMYLKHLREVQKINNRDSENLKKQIKHNLSISQIHKNNKIKAYQFNLRENLKILEQRNIKIHSKITSIGDYNMGGRRSKKINSHSLNLTNETEIKDKSLESLENKKLVKPSFHYRYRKRQQEHIEIQNAKLIKAILTQKSTILPLIKNSTGRASPQQHSPRTSQQKSPTKQQPISHPTNT